VLIPAVDAFARHPSLSIADGTDKPYLLARALVAWNERWFFSGGYGDSMWRHWSDLFAELLNIERFSQWFYLSQSGNPYQDSAIGSIGEVVDGERLEEKEAKGICGAEGLELVGIHIGSFR
jgi:hypothetical protein